MELQEVLQRLKLLKNEEMALYRANKFGIHGSNILGLTQKQINFIAKDIGKNEALAIGLYNSGIYEAKILCGKIFPPKKVTKMQMHQWVNEFENWEICDTFCMKIFNKTEWAYALAFEWCEQEHEYVKRAGFVLMATYGMANKTIDNTSFEHFLNYIKDTKVDSRTYVKKAISWALRSIGKRNSDLQLKAIATCESLLENKKNWAAQDAIKELKNPKINLSYYPRARYPKP